MCGIYLSLSNTGHILPSGTIQQRLRSRGPDSSKTVHSVSWRKDSDGHAVATNVTQLSTVLSLRGADVVAQPYEGLDEHFTLCWNGEAWCIDGLPVLHNDTTAMHDHLQKALDSEGPDSNDPTDGARVIAAALARVHGPYAFVLYDARLQRIFFGRDFLGRRSLCAGKISDQGLILSSVPDLHLTSVWTEIEADGVYCIDLSRSTGLNRQAAHGTMCSLEGFVTFNVPYAINIGPLASLKVCCQAALTSILAHTHR